MRHHWLNVASVFFGITEPVVNVYDSLFHIVSSHANSDSVDEIWQQHRYRARGGDEMKFTITLFLKPPTTTTTLRRTKFRAVGRSGTKETRKIARKIGFFLTGFLAWLLTTLHVECSLPTSGG